MSRIEIFVAPGESQGQLISAMTEHDLLEVVEIEESCGLSRWGWDAYHAELMNEGSALMFVARAVVEEKSLNGKKLKGFIASRLVADELHINNVAVREEYRRCGLGVMMLKRVLTAAREKGAKSALLEVRAGNRAAQALYAKSGFQVIGRRQAYYSEPTEDAIVMNLLITGSA